MTFSFHESVVIGRPIYRGRSTESNRAKDTHTEAHGVIKVERYVEVDATYFLIMACVYAP